MASGISRSTSNVFSSSLSLDPIETRPVVDLSLGAVVGACAVAAYCGGVMGCATSLGTMSRKNFGSISLFVKERGITNKELRGVAQYFV
jgi:hypothetical protein